MKYFSMFSGIGGFELGIHNAHEYVRQQNFASDSDVLTERGIDPLPTCVGYSEIDKYAIKVYERNFNGHTNYGDATTINAGRLPDFDLLCGGFPCQAFSIAGKRGGFDDTRGTLFFDIARILRAKRPRLCVLENVKGLLSHDRGRTFDTIIRTLDELGYDCQWQVLNSKDFGVPQNRERVFIVGHLRGTPRPQVFPIGSSHEKTVQEGDEQPISGTISTKNQSGQAQWDGSTTLVADGPDSGQEQAEPDPDFKPGRTEDSIRIRRLTPVECERLQGFPDDWTKYGLEKVIYGPKSFPLGKAPEIISDTQRYKMCGNAVTVNVVQAVMERIR